MACETVNSWTFSEIVGAFVELAIAYFLLCASTVVFFASKFLDVFGLSLPCTCNGVLPNCCLHRLLLVHCLNENVSSIQLSLKSNRPFESVLEQNQDGGHLNMRLLSGDLAQNHHEVDQNAASCSSVSSAKEFERNSFPVKKKLDEGVNSRHRVTNEKGRKGFRRRKKAESDYGKGCASSVSQSMSSYKMSREIGSNAPPPPPVDYESNPIDFGDPRERASQDVEQEIKLIERSASSSEEKMRMAVDQKEEKKDTIKILEQALAKERAMKAALYHDLEEERSAAASAADEAMAMILRLQEEKGSVEMESRQYHRMIEEKSAYHEEEMDILKEILVKREEEKYFLENEIQEYREIHDVQSKLFQDEIRLPSSSFNLSGESVSFEATPMDIEEDSRRILKKESNFHDAQVKSGWSSATDSSDAYNYYSSSRSARRVGRKNSNSPSVKGLPPLGNSKEKVALKRKSLSTVDTERLKIETEVGLLRERLRNVQAGREKIKLPVDDYREKDKIELQLLEDIARQLREIQVLTEPGKIVRQASLPPPAPGKIQSKKMCVRSASTSVLNNP